MVASEWSVVNLSLEAINPQRTILNDNIDIPEGEGIPSLEISFRDPDNNWNAFAEAFVAMIPTTGIITDGDGNSGDTKGLSAGQLETWFKIVSLAGASGQGGAGFLFRRVGVNWYYAEIYKTAGGSFWAIKKASTITSVYDIRTIASGTLPVDIPFDTWHKMRVSFETSGANCVIRLEFNNQGTGGYVICGGADVNDSQNLNNGNASNEIGIVVRLSVSSITSEENVTCKFDGTIIRTNQDV